MHVDIAVPKSSRYEYRYQRITTETVVKILGYIGNQAKLCYRKSVFRAKCQVIEAVDITIMKTDFSLFKPYAAILDRLNAIIGVTGNL